jgi:hypothetical protein
MHHPDQPEISDLSIPRQDRERERNADIIESMIASLRESGASFEEIGVFRQSLATARSLARMP